MRVTRLNSPSSPELDEAAAVVVAALDEGGVGMISEGGLLAADEFKAVADPWVDWKDFPEVILSSFRARSTWLFISQLHVLAMSLCTPLSTVPCTEEAGFFLDERRLSL